MRAKSLLLASSVILFCHACTGGEGEDGESLECSDTNCLSAALEDRVDQRFGESTSLLECGNVIQDNQALSCESLSAAELCFVDAQRDCSTAILRYVRYTVEGDPIPEIWVSTDCTISKLVDHSADSWRGEYGPRQEYACTGVEQVDDGFCVFPNLLGCELVEEW